MSEVITVALISLASSLITGTIAFLGTVVSQKSAQKITDLKQEQALESFKKDVNSALELMHAEITAQNQELKAQIAVLDEKQEKHNKIIERTYALEKSVDLLDEKEKNTAKRVDNINEKVTIVEKSILSKVSI